MFEEIIFNSGLKLRNGEGNGNTIRMTLLSSHASHDLHMHIVKILYDIIWDKL